MITQRKLNLMKVNSEVRIIKMKIWRAKKEMGNEVPPIPSVPIPPEENQDDSGRYITPEQEIGVENG
jgi:hypothetical protein